MANRRMFSKRITDSARFIKMPPSSQALYFHLGMHADDDGIVEAFQIMRLTGSNDDDLKVLSAKNFIKILNDDLVSFVTDWSEHNLIRVDRKVDSIHKELLLQIVPEAKLIESKVRTDRRRDVPTTTKGQHRLGKVRLGKVNKKDIYLDLYPKIIENLNATCGTRYKHNSIKTRQLISSRLKDGFVFEDFVGVHRKKFDEWGRDKEMAKYLRPETLYGTKFESYLNQKDGKSDAERFIEDIRRKNS